MKWGPTLLIPGIFLSQPLAGADTPPPGEGVLCLGTFLYFVDEAGRRCHAGQDPDFQARVAGYVARFDDYISRNVEGGVTMLDRFKRGQGLGVRSLDEVCTGDIARSYDDFRQGDPEQLENAINELLARDGPPSFGDCV